MQFLVKTLSATNAVALVRIEAADGPDAQRQLAARGYHVLSAKPVSPLGKLRSGGATKFPLLLFNQELLSLLDSGISIVEAIETLAEKENRPAVRMGLQDFVIQLREGKTFSAALEAANPPFAPLYVATVRASERTSGLSEALGRYIAYASQLEAVRAKLVSAAIYPVMLVGVSILVLLFLMGFVVPRFAHIYEDMGGDLPYLSQVLLWVGLAVERYWPLVLGALVAVVVALVNGAGNSAGRWVLVQLWRIPAVGERMRVFQLARLFRTLGMLQRGGISIMPALEMVAGMLSSNLQPRLDAARNTVSEGQPLSSAFEAQGLTTPVALRMLRVGERAGNMGEMMERIAAFHDEEIARWADWATRLIGPVLMLVMGLFIGAIVVLMYLPIFQLADSIQ
jgi:general secretion pathway protein F